MKSILINVGCLILISLFINRKWNTIPENSIALKIWRLCFMFLFRHEKTWEDTPNLYNFGFASKSQNNNNQKIEEKFVKSSCAIKSSIYCFKLEVQQKLNLEKLLRTNKEEKKTRFCKAIFPKGKFKFRIIPLSICILV